MCLAIPMKLVEINDEGFGRVDAAGVRADVNLMMIPHATIGDYLIVHAGFGIEVLDTEEALIRMDLFKEIAEATADMEEV
jgi:hydrogenase expression/formation protein HypC